MARTPAQLRQHRQSAARSRARKERTWTYDDVIRRVLEGPDPPPPKPPRAPRRRCQARPDNPCPRFALCSCRYCDAHCRTLCYDPRAPRARSACLHCAWCAVCHQRFPFQKLAISGPDLCNPCTRL